MLEIRTDAQFESLVKLMSLRDGPTREVVRLVFVEGMAIADAARAAGIGYPMAYNSVRRVTNFLNLVSILMGETN